MESLNLFFFLLQVSIYSYLYFLSVLTVLVMALCGVMIIMTGMKIGKYGLLVQIEVPQSHLVIPIGVYIVACQAHPALVEIGPVLAPSF